MVDLQTVSDRSDNGPRMILLDGIAQRIVSYGTCDGPTLIAVLVYQLIRVMSHSSAPFQPSPYHQHYPEPLREALRYDFDNFEAVLRVEYAGCLYGMP